MGPVEKVVAIVLVLAVVVQPRTAEAVNSQLDIGVSYGLKGDNLPSPPNVIQLYKKYRIGKMRLFNPVPEVLAALKGSGIEVTLGVLNQDLQTLATGWTRLGGGSIPTCNPMSMMSNSGTLRLGTRSSRIPWTHSSCLQCRTCRRSSMVTAMQV